MGVGSKLINITMKIGNAIISLFDGGLQRPVIFNTLKTYPQLSLLEDSYERIKTEFENLDNHFDIHAYHEIERRQYAISGKLEPHLKWKVFMLHYSGETPKLANELCPETCALLKKVPKIYKAFFSILEPGKSIPPHCGPYRGYLRYHFGISVPETNPPQIRIKDQLYTWKEKESVLFDDTWEHEVINSCDSSRVVLIIDLLRPLPLLPHTINALITKVILKRIRIKKVLKEVEKLNQNRKAKI